MRILIASLLVFCLPLAVSAREQGNYTLYDRNYRINGYVSNGKIYDKNYRIKGYVKDNKVYDREYRERGSYHRGGSGKGRKK
jgi:hypothetical protein